MKVKQTLLKSIGKELAKSNVLIRDDFIIGCDGVRLKKQQEIFNKLIKEKVSELVNWKDKID